MVALLRQALALLPSVDSAIRARLEGFFALEAFYSVPDSDAGRWSVAPWRWPAVSGIPRRSHPC